MSSVSTAKLFKKRTTEVNAISQSSNIVLHAIFIIFAMACILPMLIVLGVSFTAEDQIISHGYRMIPPKVSLDAYRYLFQSSGFVGRAYLNTILATLFGTVITVVLVALFAYPISRKDFRYRNGFTFFLFFTMLFNGGLVPFYMVNRNIIQIYNTLWALFLPISFNAFWVIVMRTFYKNQIPDSLIEASRIDGASEWRTLLQIVIPLSLPGLATVALFSTIGIWNNFFLCLLLTDGQENMNLQYMIYTSLTKIQFMKDMASKTGSADLAREISKLPDESFRMAMAIVTVGPIIFAYPFFQKYFIKGLSIGALKG